MFCGVSTYLLLLLVTKYALRRIVTSELLLIVVQKAMWNKFMINIGINQTCMVYETDYGGATTEGSEAFLDMKNAMHEVIQIAAAE